MKIVRARALVLWAWAKEVGFAYPGKETTKREIYLLSAAIERESVEPGSSLRNTGEGQEIMHTDCSKINFDQIQGISIVEKMIGHWSGLPREAVDSQKWPGCSPKQLLMGLGLSRGLPETFSDMIFFFYYIIWKILHRAESMGIFTELCLHQWERDTNLCLCAQLYKAAVPLPSPPEVLAALFHWPHSPISNLPNSTPPGCKELSRARFWGGTCMVSWAHWSEKDEWDFSSAE